MQNAYSVADHWTGEYDEAALQAWAESLRGRLQASTVSLGLVLIHPRYASHAHEILEVLRVHAQVPLLAGCTGRSLIMGEREIEEDAGLVLGLFHLPGARLHGTHFTQTQLDACTGPDYWPQETGVTPEQSHGWLVFADPFHMDCEGWLKSWNEAYPKLPILGGLASADSASRSTQVYLNGDVFEEGGVGISIGGEVRLVGVISQGCTPIGETWTITKAEQNFIHEIANRPAYQVLEETFQALPPREQRQARGNLFVGMATNEYLEEFRRGDFLIRNLIGADPTTGTLAVGAFPRTGQTIQFQRRDAASSTEDMTQLLKQARADLEGRIIYGGCLCSCNGRGLHLFGEPDHDARHVQEYLGPLGLPGFFCNGEIGPVGGRNFLHGYTASVALFVN
jgi:small ligand-binding sensory domain FIST